MTPEQYEYKMTLTTIAQAFKKLEQKDRLDVLAGLTEIVRKEINDSGLLNEWLIQAHSALKASCMIYSPKKMDNSANGKNG